MKDINSMIKPSLVPISVIQSIENKPTKLKRSSSITSLLGFKSDQPKHSGIKSKISNYDTREM